MQSIFNLFFFIMFSITVFSQTVGFVNKKTPFVRAMGDYFGNSVSISDKYMIVGSYENDTDSINANYIGTAGAAYIYELNDNNNWIQKQKLAASDRLIGDQFGYSVSISDNYAVVGAPYWDINNAVTNTNDGAAYVFKRDINGIWVQTQRLLAADFDTTDNFGISVAISGNYIIVGASKDEQDSIGLNRLANSGSAYFFERDTSNDIWTQVKKVVGSNRASGDNFGNSVSICGDIAVVGAMNHTTDSAGGNPFTSAGAAYVFERNISGNWLQVEKLTAADRSYQAYFGSSVSVSGNDIAVGAYFEGMNNTGAVYTYQKIIDKWNYIQKLTASDKQMFDSFGRSISLQNNYLMVGAYNQDFDSNGLNSLSSAGAAYFFVREDSIWNQQQKIVAPDRAASDIFGYSLAISNDQIVVGSYFNKLDSASANSLSNAGAIYIFQTCVPTTLSIDTIDICDGDSALIFGIYQKTDGIYSDSLVSFYGCDSVLTITLQVNQPSYSFDTISSCNSYLWNDSTYINSGSYAWNGTNANGCDSIANLELAIINSATGTDTRTECKSFTWIDGIIYTSSNDTATFNIVGGAANGCDSLVTLNLTINNVADLTTTLIGDTITTNDTTATYVWLDCDNNYAVIPGETSQSFITLTYGNYAVELTENGCVDTSDCVSISTVGIIHNSFASNFNIYPNPTSGNLLIVFDAKQDELNVTLYSIDGKLLENRKAKNVNNLSFEIESPAGVYLFKITNNKNQSALLKVLKK